jgi:hypothetical protein
VSLNLDFAEPCAHVVSCTGDLILTTQFQWHDHGNEGDDACLWLDCLDQPLFAGNFPIVSLTRSRAAREKIFPLTERSALHHQNFQMRFMNHPDSNGSRYHDSKLVTGAEAPEQCKRPFLSSGAGRPQLTRFLL